MKTFFKYLRIYQKFVETSFSEAMSFRTSFILIIIMDIFFYASTLLSVSFIYEHVSTIGPWSKYQLLFFLSFMLALDQIHMTIVSTNFWMLSHDIRTGQFDFTLLRPAHSIFTAFFRHFRAPSSINCIVTFSLMIYYGSKLHLSFLDWVLIPPFLLLSLCLLCQIEFILSASMFWLVEGVGINFLRIQLQTLSRWPDFIYTYTTRKFLTLVFPLLLIGSAPVQFLYDKSKWDYILSMISAIIILGILLHYIWKKSLRNYHSASS